MYFTTVLSKIQYPMRIFNNFFNICACKEIKMKEFRTKYTVRTDLAVEARAYSAEKGDTSDGIITASYEKSGLIIEELIITNETGSRTLSKPCGRYVTVNAGKIWSYDRQAFDNAAEVTAGIIRSFIPERGSCLFCGMGNAGITADAFGPLAAENFIVTNHIKSSDPDLFSSLGLRQTMCAVPGVLAKTGIEGAKIIEGIIKRARPDFAIVADALASRKLSRLGTTIQICDSGISPGSGVNNARSALSRESLGIPVIAIGVPTVVDAQTLALDILSDAAQKSENPESFSDAEKLLAENPSAFFVTPKDTDHIVRDAAKLVAFSVNLALHNDMTTAEIEEFLS